MKIKGTLLATAAGFAAPVIGVSAAGAADMPLKAAPAPAPVPISWAGWYIGGHLGGAWLHSEFSTDNLIGRSHSRSAFIGGGQIGYNWQNGNAVYGIEVDGSWLGGKTKTCFDQFDCGKGWAETKSRWLATVRGRVGLAVGNAMAYVTGGVAFAGVRATISNCCETKSASKTKVGWVVGGGVEAMWTRNWSWAIEGLFVDLGRHNVNSADCCNKTSRFSNQAVIGRVKLNYRF